MKKYLRAGRYAVVIDTNAVYHSLSVGPKAALGVCDGKTPQEVGGEIQHLHADLAIAGNLLTVAVAKPRAYDQIHASVRRKQDIASLRFGIWDGLVVCMGR